MSDSVNQNHNIPTGSPVGVFSSYISILRLVWPLALGMVNNAVMQFADRAYLARHSFTALQAALPAGILMWIFAGFFQSVVGYSSVFVGQYHGAGEAQKCREVYRGALLMAIGSAFLTWPLMGVGDWILAKTTENACVLADQRAYFRILMMGTLFVYAQMAAASYFTGRGQTRIVFGVNVIGNLLNIILDPLLIFGWCGCPKLGIAGAAYATVASMALQTLILVWAAGRCSLGRIDRHVLWRMLRFGVPSGFFTVLNMASFAIFVFVTEGVGELELAVSNACFTVNYLLFAPMEGFALGAATLVAQAIGRGDREGAARAARRTLYLGVGFAAILSVITLCNANHILDLFATTAGEQAGDFHALGRLLLCLMAAWLLFDATDIILGGALKGAGDTRFVMTWALVCAFILWMPLVFIVRHYYNTMPALWATMIIYVIAICIGSFVRWHHGAWRRIQLI